MIARSCSLIRYQLDDYVVWRRHFNDQEAPRRISGCLGHALFRVSEDEVAVQLFFADQEVQERFFSDADALECLQHHGGELQQFEREYYEPLPIPALETIAYMQGVDLNTESIESEVELDISEPVSAQRLLALPVSS